MSSLSTSSSAPAGSAGGKRLEQFIQGLKLAFGKAQYKSGSGAMGAMAGDRPRFVDPNFSYQNAKALKRGNGLISKLINKNVSNVVGAGFTFQVDNDKEELQNAAKNVLDRYTEAMMLKRLLKQGVEELFVTGALFIEKVYDNYLPPGQIFSLPPQIIDSLREADVPFNAFTLPAPGANLLGIKRILPTEQMLPIVNRKGTIIAFKQMPGGRDPIMFAPQEMIFMAINVPAGNTMGVGLIEPVYSDAVELDKIVSLLPVIVRNYSEPKPVFVAPDKKTAIDFKDFINTLQPGQKPVVWGKIDVKVLDLPGEGSKFIEYINYLTQRVQEHLFAPSQTILHNATEASARVLNEDYQTFVQIMQEYLAEVLEQELFKPLLMNNFSGGTQFWTVTAKGEKELIVDVPKIMWGVPASQLDRVDRNALLTQLATRSDFPIEIGLQLLKELDVPIELDEQTLAQIRDQKAALTAALKARASAPQGAPFGGARQQQENSGITAR